MNLPSSVVFGLGLLAYDGASDPVQAIAGHLTATVLSGLFAFFVVLTAQGGLLSVFGATTAKRAALVVQAALVVGVFESLRREVPHRVQVYIDLSRGGHDESPHEHVSI